MTQTTTTLLARTTTSFIPPPHPLLPEDLRPAQIFLLTTYAQADKRDGEKDCEGLDRKIVCPDYFSQGDVVCCVAQVCATDELIRGWYLRVPGVVLYPPPPSRTGTGYPCACLVGGAGGKKELCGRGIGLVGVKGGSRSSPDLLNVWSLLVWFAFRES